MRHFVRLFFAVVACVLAAGGCEPDPKADGPKKIEGRVVLNSKVLPGTYAAAIHPDVAQANPASGAKVYLSADEDGKQPVSPVATADPEGRFSFTADGRLRDYWLVVEHPDGIALRTKSYNMHVRDYDNVIIALQLRRRRTDSDK